MLRLNYGTMALATLAALLVLPCPTATAQTTVPFGVSGMGVVEFVPLPGGTATHFANGTASYLGQYRGRGAVQTLTLNPATGTGTFQSAVPFVFEGQNGTLSFHYGRTDQGAPVGVVKLIPAERGKVIAVWDAEFTLVNASGINVTGGRFRMVATSAPFVPGGTVPVRYSWSGAGTITFGP